MCTREQNNPIYIKENIEIVQKNGISQLIKDHNLKVQMSSMHLKLKYTAVLKHIQIVVFQTLFFSLTILLLPFECSTKKKWKDRKSQSMCGKNIRTHHYTNCLNNIEKCCRILCTKFKLI